MLATVVVLGPVFEGKNTQPIFRVVKYTQTGLDEIYKAVPNMREVAVVETRRSGSQYAKISG